MRSTLTYYAGLLVILICAAGFYQVHEKAGLPFAFDRGSLIIGEIAQPSSIETGDRLIAIDGVHVASVDEVEFVLDSQNAGQAVRIVLEHDGTMTSRNVLLVRYFSTRYLIIQFLTASVFIFLGLFVFTKRKNDPAAQMFNLVSLSAAVIIAATWGKFNVAPIGLGYAVRAAFHVAYACAGILFLHFTLLFPSVRTPAPARLLRLLYTTAIGLSIAGTYFFAAAAADMNMASFRIYNAVFNAVRLYFAACMLAGLAVIVRTYAVARDEAERRKLRWILLGLAAGPLCFIALWVIPQVLSSRGIVDEEFVVMLMLTVPVTFAISIVKYHIMNIDQIFKRTTVYSMALSFVLMLYVVIVSISSLFIGTLTVTSSLLISTLAAAAVAAMFHPVRERMQQFVDRKFFNVRYNYREAEKEFIERIVFCYDESSVCAAVTETVRRLIPNTETYLCLLNRRQDDPNESLPASLREHEAPLFLSEHIELGARFVPANAGLFGRHGTAAAFRIHSETSGLLGCLLLGTKLSGFRYNLEDVDLLESFCHQAALALDRVNLQHSLITEHLETNRLKELNDLKSFFVSSVSHELKTPLTSIGLFAELMEDTPDLTKRKRAEFLGIIKGESERLSRLIDNVLDLSKIEKGMKEYRFSPVELNECVNKALAAMQFQFSLHGFECRTRLSRKRLMICADRDAVLEILFNLLANAIKYASQKKRIIVTTRTVEAGARLEVRDFGIGIEQRDLKKIFDPFERTDAALVRNAPGVGLGLALVKHIAEAHKATVVVESLPGRGSTFSITFPFLTTESIA